MSRKIAEESNIKAFSSKEKKAIADKIAYFFFDYFKNRDNYTVISPKSGFS
ncbi:MAG: hypothetical protein ABIG91_00550 [Patescibacteria group bacterium]